LGVTMGRPMARPVVLVLAPAKAVRASRPKATNDRIHWAVEGDRSRLGLPSKRPGIAGPPSFDAGAGAQLADDVVHIHDIAGVPTQALLERARQGAFVRGHG